MKQKQRGFTLIEVMIATAIFVVVIVMGMGALLSVYKTYQVDRGMRELTDNVNSIMEDMSRNIRTGKGFMCSTQPGLASINVLPDCISSSSLSSGLVGGYSLIFQSQDDDPTAADSIVYSIELPTGVTSSSDAVVMKSIDSGTTYTPITISGVKIDMAKSGFIVTGTGAGDHHQTYVLVRLVGTLTYKNTTTAFNIQNTISPRDLDLDVTP